MDNDGYNVHPVPPPISEIKERIKKRYESKIIMIDKLLTLGSLHTPRYTPSLHTVEQLQSNWCCGGARFAHCAVLCLVTWPSHASLETQPQPGPATPLFAATWLALNSCNQAGAAEARFAYFTLRCLVTDLVTWPSHASLETQPQPEPATPLFPKSISDAWVLL